MKSWYILLAPDAFRLEQNYPNPFNPSTTITFSLQRASAVQLKIFDLLNREVRTLGDEEQNAGTYSLVWNGQDESGAPVALAANISTGLSPEIFRLFENCFC